MWIDGRSRKSASGKTFATLNPATGAVTSGATPFTANRALVMSYRTDARFGYKRHFGDTVQAAYVPPANDSADIGQEQGVVDHQNVR